MKADDKFINEMNNDNEEPMAKVAGKLIQTKNSLNRIINLIRIFLKDSVPSKRKILILPQDQEKYIQLKKIQVPSIIENNKKGVLFYLHGWQQCLLQVE